jgi:hypothetical protein
MGQHHQKTRAPIGRNPIHGETFSAQHDFMFSKLKFAAVDLQQQIRYILGNDFDHVLRERVLRRQARRATNGTLGPISIAAPAVAPAHGYRRPRR